MGQRRRTLGGRWFIAPTLILLALVAAPNVWAQQAAPRVSSRAEVQFNLGVADYEQRNYEEALKEFLDALQEDPLSVDILYYTGLTLNALGRYSEALPYLQKAAAQEPENVGVRQELGHALFGLERYVDALPHLQFAFDKDPTRESLGYFLGFIYFQRKDCPKALEYFIRNASDDPKMVQLNQYHTALCHQILGATEEAKAEFSEAARIEPTSPLALAARKVLESLTLAARPPVRRLRVQVTVGGQYDTNVAVAPTNEISGLFLTTKPEGGRRKKDSLGILASARLEYAYFMAEKSEATVFGSVYQTVNFKNVRQTQPIRPNESTGNFNIEDYTVGLGYTNQGQVAKLPYQTGTQVAYDYLFLSAPSKPPVEAQLLQRITGLAYLTVQEDKANLSSLSYRIQAKDFFRDPVSPFDIAAPSTSNAENRDGINNMVGAAHYFQFDGGKNFLKVGYQFDNEDTRGADFSYFGNKPLAGFGLSLPWNFRLSFDWEFHARTYKNTNQVFPDRQGNARRRVDHENIFLTSLSRPIVNNVTASLDYLFDQNQSNLAIFEYRRHVITLSLTWRY